MNLNWYRSSKFWEHLVAVDVRGPAVRMNGWFVWDPISAASVLISFLSFTWELICEYIYTVTLTKYLIPFFYFKSFVLSIVPCIPKGINVSEHYFSNIYVYINHLGLLLKYVAKIWFRKSGLGLQILHF